MTACERVLGGFVAIVLAVLVYLKVEHGDLIDGLYFYFPYVPTHWFANGSVWGLYYGTCVIGNPFAVKCRTNDNELWVTVAAPKGGVVFGVRTAIDIAISCGLCVGHGYRKSSIWPPEEEYVPTYDSDVLLGVARMKRWPEYAKKHRKKVKCVVLLRHPRHQFHSLYKYTLKAGEYGLRDLATQLWAKHNESIPEAVDFLYRRIGKETMENSAEYLSLSLAQPECIGLKIEDFERDFNGTMLSWINHWGVLPSSRDYVLGIASKHDLKQKSEEMLNKEHHTTTGLLSKAESQALDRAIRDHKELNRMILYQARLFGYETQSTDN